MAKLRVVRVGTGWYDLGKLDVIVDGERVGRIRRLERMTFEVTAGPHSVMVRMKNVVSPTVAIEASEHEPLDLEADLPFSLVGINDGFLAAFRTYEVFRAPPDIPTNPEHSATIRKAAAARLLGCLSEATETTVQARIRTDVVARLRPSRHSGPLLLS